MAEETAADRLVDEVALVEKLGGNGIVSDPGRLEATIHGSPSAVGEEHGAGDVAGGVRGEKERRPIVPPGARFGSINTNSIVGGQ